MHPLLLAVFFIPVFIRSSAISECIVGLLDDANDITNRLAFISETQKYNLRHSIQDISTDHFYDTLSTTCDMLGEGVVALFGPQTDDNSQIVHSVCYSKDIPHIETRWNDNPQRATFTVNLHPHTAMFARILAELVDSKTWKNFAIFYDDHQSLSRISGILKVERESAISIKQLDPNNTGNYRPILKEAWKEGFRHFVLDCHINRLSNVLKQAQQIGLMTSENAYVITNPDLQTIDLEPYKYSDTNITGIRMTDPDSEAAIRLAESMNTVQTSMEIYQHHVQYILSNEIRLETALLADGLNLLSMALNSLPEENKCFSTALCNNTSSWRDGATVLASLKTISFEGITGLVKLDANGFRQEFHVDVVELREDGLIKIGAWDAEKGITYLQRNGEEDNLQNNSFVVIMTLTAPYGMLKESSQPLIGNDRFEGFGIDLIHELSLVERFNYTFIIREDKSNGDWNNQTKQWSGMIGDILTGVADLAISDLTITSERKDAVDFTTPFMNLGISILYRKPSKAPPNFFSFAAPFAVEVWIWIGVAYFIVSISLFIMGRLCPSEWTNPYPCVENPEYLINQFSLRNSFWFMLGSVLQQGSEIAPIGYATRMTAGAWWFFTLIIVSTYTANLAAFLTTETPDVPFSDVYELLSKAPKMSIKYGAKAKGATLAFFRGSKNEEFQQIFAYMNEHEEVMVKENQDGVARAERELYAFFMESVSIEYEIQRHCNLTQIGDMLDEKGYGIAMRKNSTYRHKLNTALLKLQENGKISELKRKWWEERRGGGQCGAETKTDEAPALTLKHVGGVFWVTVYGTMLAIVLVFFEMFAYIMRKSIRHKKPFCVELKEELKFYLKCSGLVKPVRKGGKRSSKSPGDSDNSKEVVEKTEDADFGFLPDITNPTF